MDNGEDEHTSPIKWCPVKQRRKPPFGCVRCPYLGYTVRRYLTCAHPDVEFDDTPLPEFVRPMVWVQESLFGAEEIDGSHHQAAWRQILQAPRA